MASDAVVIGCAVSIPAAVALVILFFLWQKTQARFKKELLADGDIDQEDQLSFHNLTHQDQPRFSRGAQIAMGDAKGDKGPEALPMHSGIHQKRPLMALSATLNSLAHDDTHLSYYDTMVPVLSETEQPGSYAKRLSNPNLLNYTSTPTNHSSGGYSPGSPEDSTRNSSRLNMSAHMPKPPHHLAQLTQGGGSAQFDLDPSEQSSVHSQSNHRVSDSMISGFSQVDTTMDSDLDLVPPSHR